MLVLKRSFELYWYAAASASVPGVYALVLIDRKHSYIHFKIKPPSAARKVCVTTSTHRLNTDTELSGVTKIYMKATGNSIPFGQDFF